MELSPLTDEDVEVPPEENGESVDGKAKPKSGRHEGDGPSSLLGAKSFLAQPADALLRVHFIDIGQGDSTLLECPNGAKILVDFGSHTRGEKRARKYLRKVLGDDKVDDLVITHPDGDHYNKVHWALEGVTVDQAWLVGTWADYKGGDEAKAWLQGLDQAGKVAFLDAAGPYHDIDAPHPGFDCGEAKVWVLSAGAKGTNRAWRKNTSSIVLLISYGDFDVMLTGDATTETEEAMIRWYCPEDWKPGEECWLRSEVLKMGHHGSRTTSTGTRFAAAVAPDVAIASATRHKKHGHPGRDAVRRLHPYTHDHAGHRFLWWENKSTKEELDDYRESNYSTAVNRNIYVESDGATYRVQP